MEGLMEYLVPALGVLVVAILGFGIKWLKDKASKTDTKLDDAAIEAVEKAFEDAKDKK